MGETRLANNNGQDARQGTAGGAGRVAEVVDLSQWHGRLEVVALFGARLDDGLRLKVPCDALPWPRRADEYNYFPMREQ
jgi:hypothetical protein